ncbi:MAG: hypothetical protein HY744_05030 [Deltaproteobacteria bacterium]|nr:hypothetical protein [Deltaproteobacteria bacterium]
MSLYPPCLLALLLGLLAGCVSYGIKGGRSEVDIEVPQGDFVHHMTPIVEESPAATTALKRVESSKNKATVLSCLSLVLDAGAVALIGGGVAAESPIVTAGAVPIALVGGVLAAIGAAVGPDDADFAAVLQAYNDDFPQWPLASADLGVRRPLAPPARAARADGAGRGEEPGPPAPSGTWGVAAHSGKCRRIVFRPDPVAKGKGASELPSPTAILVTEIRQQGQVLVVLGDGQRGWIDNACLPPPGGR